MDSTNRVPDADPAASSFPPIPLPPSADVPEVVRERHDEPDRPEVRRTLETIYRAMDAEYERGWQAGARAALAKVARALRATDATQVLAVLDVMLEERRRRHPLVVEALDAITDAAEAGGGS